MFPWANCDGAAWSAADARGARARIADGGHSRSRTGNRGSRAHQPCERARMSKHPSPPTVSRRASRTDGVKMKEDDGHAHPPADVSRTSPSRALSSDPSHAPESLCSLTDRNPQPNNTMTKQTMTRRARASSGGSCGGRPARSCRRSPSSAHGVSDVQHDNARSTPSTSIVHNYSGSRPVPRSPLPGDDASGRSLSAQARDFPAPDRNNLRHPQRPHGRTVQQHVSLTVSPQCAGSLVWIPIPIPIPCRSLAQPALWLLHAPHRESMRL
ncbi:hypothetical protein CALCODRAFT_329395 [Calocera cornea HHB12733]|uniref:Uncharacterized protein n=1 Tax=Calocera cornea HHB12733 TaxID=1353952 RepID=A0A165JJ70_9BASI|nr:hypothetical protein CALCODRAFT_329395 [Calocera cornea HHB12733]